MIDLEQTLRDSLRAYIDAVEPGPPPPTPIVAESPAPRRTLALLAAAVLLLAGVAGLWWTSDDRGDDSAPSDSVVAPVEATAGTWTIPSESPLSPRQFPTVAWTGTEFIVWGGVVGNTGLTDGALYDPATDTWRPMAEPPSMRPGAAATWTGTRLVAVSERSAAAYNPATDTWEQLPARDPFDPTTPFTDVVWTGTDLLAISISHNDPEYVLASMAVWRLDGDRWVTEEMNSTSEGRPASRYLTTTDQILVHSPVALPDGFAVWDGDRAGWKFTIGTGWTPLPSPVQYFDDVLISDGRLVSLDGELVLLATGKTADTDDLRIARLVDGAWSGWGIVNDRAPMGWSVLAADDKIVVLDASDGSGTPLLVDPVAGTTTPLAGYPIDTVIDRSAAWSGSQLFVFGGQRSTGSGETSTESTGTVSAAAALWTMSGADTPTDPPREDTPQATVTATSDQIRRFAEAAAVGANPVEIELSRRTHAADTATVACLAELGFGDLPILPALRPEGPETWFGPDDPTPSSDDDSGPGWPSSPELRAATDGDRSATFDTTALDGSVDGWLTVPLGGCRGDALAAEFGSAEAYARAVNDAALVQEVINAAFTATVDSGTFVDMEAEWRQCMALAGRPDVPGPRGPVDESSLVDPGVVADWTRCRRSVRYLETASDLLAQEIADRISATPQVRAIVARWAQSDVTLQPERTAAGPAIVRASSTAGGAALGPPGDMTLTVVNGCLGATYASVGGTGDVAIWPQGTTWDADRQLVVFADGRAVAIGDTVSARSVSGYIGSEALSLVTTEDSAGAGRCVESWREVLFIDL